MRCDAEIRSRSRAREQHGFTLIDVLVAILVFSLGMLGIVGLYVRAQQYSAGAEDRTTAALMSNEIIATMWANKALNPNGTNPSSSDLTAWQSRVSAGLPSANGSVTTESDGVTRDVTINWMPPSAASGAASAAYVTKVVLP